MGSPRISVIMGVYNCPTKTILCRAVDSIINQTYEDFEFIICDDGSDNDTYRWLLDLQKKDSRIRVIRNQNNMSLAHALNRCVKHARGSYIARQDADDYSLPDRFKRQVEYLDSHENVAFCGTDCLLFNNDGEFAAKIMPHNPKKADFLFNSPFIHGSVMFRRGALVAAGGYVANGRCKKYEDYDLFMRMYKMHYSGANINSGLYAFEFDMNTRKVGFNMRVDEVAVRYNGFRSMGLLPVGWVYVIKPLLLAMIPSRFLNRLKCSVSHVSHL